MIFSLWKLQNLRKKFQKIVLGMQNFWIFFGACLLHYCSLRNNCWMQLDFQPCFLFSFLSNPIFNHIFLIFHNIGHIKCYVHPSFRLSVRNKFIRLLHHYKNKQRLASSLHHRNSSWTYCSTNELTHWLAEKLLFKPVQLSLHLIQPSQVARRWWFCMSEYMVNLMFYVLVPTGFVIKFLWRKFVEFPWTETIN